MKPARFSYRRPASLAAALALLEEHGSEAAILAGGQSLMPMLNLRFARPAVLVDIKRIPGLGGVTLDGDSVVVGAITRHVDVAASPVTCDHAPLIRQAMAYVAHAAVRNRGTFGGSLALADPSAEMPACCVCVDASIHLVSSGGARDVAASEFFRGVYDTALEPGEMIAAVRIPRYGADWRWAFDEASRRHGDFAIAGVALGVRLDKEVIADCRLAFCGVETFTRRLTYIEQALAGLSIADEAGIATAVKRLADMIEPMGSGEYPAAYRIAVASALLRRAIAKVSW
ncbi:MAG TPA: FAD binding domain-containing protein [Pseudolabrys sp.]|nr:FAD binding domain-containing protein [Pseudolabrys sp.]